MAMAKRRPKEMVALLAGKGGTLHNIKFFRGDRELVCAHEIEEQVRWAHLQKAMGRAIISEHFPDSETRQTDVKDLVNSL